MATKGETHLDEWMGLIAVHILCISAILSLACDSSSGTWASKDGQECVIYDDLLREIHSDSEGIAVARWNIGDPLLMSYIDAVRARSEKAWEALPSDSEPLSDDASVEEIDRALHQEFLKNVRDNFEEYESDHDEWVARLMNLIAGLDRSTVDDFVDKNTPKLTTSIENCSIFSKDVTLLRKDYVEEIYLSNSDGPAWREIKLLYPAVERVVLLSAIGCNDDVQQCLVHSLTVRLKGGQAKGEYYLFTGNENAWSIGNRLSSWGE